MTSQEIGTTAGDGVGGLDAAVAVLAAYLRGLRRGGGLCLVGKAPGVGPGAGLHAIFVLAGAHAPGVAVGGEEQPVGVVAFAGEDDGEGGLVLGGEFQLEPALAERAAAGVAVVPGKGGGLLRYEV